MSRFAAVSLVLLSVCGGFAGGNPGADAEAEPRDWSEAELRSILSLEIANLGDPPADPSNRFADDEGAARLGRLLFFDPGLSASGAVSCATCHQPERAFTDGLPRSKGLGTTKRNAPTLIGAQYSPWFYWDGRKDSQWSQAIAPLLHVDEMGSSVESVADRIRGDRVYRKAFEERFSLAVGETSDLELLVLTAKALAAYQRKLVPAPSKFDRYVESLRSGVSEPDAILNREELAGLRLFVSPRIQCLRCHNGPMLTNHGFHNIGAPGGGSEQGTTDPERGRIDAVEQVLADPFNCVGPHSDAQPVQCVELNYIKREGEELPGALKVPTLRNVARTAPYFQLGQFETLTEVLGHYARPPQNPLGHQELVGTNFTKREKEQLIAFLKTLDSSPAEPGWAEAPVAADP